MKIISCCKAVPEEQDLVVLGNREISIEKAEWKFGQYDLNAVEAGKQLIDAVGGELSGLSIGGAVLENTKLRKDILSRGLDDLHVVIDGSLENADTLKSAKVLEAAIKKMGSFDIVLCGAGSSDVYAQQVGNILGELLEVPVVNDVNKITVEGGKAIVERVLEKEVQVLEVSLPAVFSVSSEINTPRIAGMKDIIAANRKKVNAYTLSDIGASDTASTTSVVSTLAPEQMNRQLNILEGDSEDVIDEFVKLISAELK